MKNKRNFADVIIVVCVVMLIIVTACVIYEYHRLDTVISSGALGVIFAAFSGELLTIALRQIFGSDAISKSKKTSKGTNDRNERI